MINTKITKFKLLTAQLNGEVSEWVEEKLKSVSFDEAGIINEVTLLRVGTENSEDIKVIVDGIAAFVQESTNMFDMDGVELYHGDIVEVPISKVNIDFSKNPNPTPEEIAAAVTQSLEMLPVDFINGAFCLVMENTDQMLHLDQNNVRQMKKVGNVYQHGKLLEKPIDEAEFVEKLGSATKPDESEIKDAEFTENKVEVTGEVLGEEIHEEVI